MINLGVAPQGKSVIKMVTEGNYDYWKKMREEDIKNYRNEKEAIYTKVLEVLERRFPGISDEVEVHDVTTPVTVERFTFNYHGWQAWPVPDGGLRSMMSGLSKTLPGLNNFHMVGQWSTTMIGIPNAALTGRNLINYVKRIKENLKR